MKTEKVRALADLDWTKDQRTGEQDKDHRPHEGVLDTLFNTKADNEKIDMNRLEYDRRYEENSLNAQKGRK